MIKIKFFSCGTAQWVVMLVVVATSALANLHTHFNHQMDALVDDELYYVKAGISAAEMLQARGYVAETYKITTGDGYILQITRGLNPLVNEGKRSLDGKMPILFLHGATVSSASYMLNSAGVRPKVYETQGGDLSKLSVKQLAELLGEEPTKRTLPFLALNFGYEVWFLDRRGYHGSRGKVGHENRTLADAWASIPDTLLGGAMDGFSMDAGLEHGRPFRRSAGKMKLFKRQLDSDGNQPQQQLEVEARALKQQHWKRANVGRQLAQKIEGAAESTLKTGLKATGIDKLTGSEHKQANEAGQEEGPRGWRPARHGNFLQALLSISKLTHTLRRLLRDTKQQFIETFDPVFWKFSLDEQAEIDLPAAIDFVLEKSGKPKLHAVGLSCGGAVILLGLAEKPELAEKVSRVVLWAPSVNMGSRTDIVYLLGYMIPLAQSYVGPLPFVFMTPMIEAIMQTLCASEFMQRTVCEAALGAIMGWSGGQAPVRPYMLSNWLMPTSFGELQQLAQFARTNFPCKFNMNSKQENLVKYGQEKAPCYDLGRVAVRNISFYTGNHDALVSADDTVTTASQLSVPSEVHIINKKGVYFNHLGCILHREADKLIILPSFLDIERSQAEERAATGSRLSKSSMNSKQSSKQHKMHALGHNSIESD